MDRADVIVVGAGAAGIIASWRAASLGGRVLLLEKTPRIGTKILISGGGKCNITHDGPLEQLLKAFRPNEERFIRPSCYRFQNRQIVEMLTSRGLEVYTRPDGRIFPVDQTAKDVVRILSSYLEEASVDVRLDTPVSGLAIKEGQVQGVLTPLGTIAASQVIVCAGGSSYPNSGTTGDGWKWARDAGHTIVKVRAALAPIYLKLDSEVMANRSGIAIRDCLLKARFGGKVIAKWRGDLLFTHHGISGPCALGISREVAERLQEGPIGLEVDLTPDWIPEVVSEKVLKHTTAYPKRLVGGFVEEFVADRLVSSVMSAAGLNEDVTGAKLDRKSRNRLAETLKNWQIGEVRAVPIEKGEVVAGGVSLDEVDPHTMRSRLVSGLYFCGEVLDIAGPVGGYNLQAAFAGGYVAGEKAAKEAKTATFKES